MRIIKAPEKYFIFKQEGERSVFLAGSIEQDKADHWQNRIVNEFKDAVVPSVYFKADVVLLNPRRDGWDSSWEQRIDNPQFREQVEWELAAMETADIIAMYFDKETKSPITLMELGLFARSGKLIVCCPDGFWRKGNVDIVCRSYGITQVINESDLILTLKQKLGVL